MNPERWREIDRLFHEAAALPAEQREAFLAGACPDDEALRREVLSLLRHRDEPAPFLDEPPVAGLHIDPEDLLDAGSDPLLGRMIGPYRIERHIATGGMGSVYHAARRDDFLTHEVAIKVLHRSMDSDELRRRFRIERQTLANLAHPSIARLHDAGVTPDGLPYMVMEFIEGLPIDEHCDRHRLDLPARLRLFQTVCAAVHFAHQNLVVHRDLKPSNILVTPGGTPKLLDFGVAKVLDPDEEAAPAARTETMRQMLSIEYASPEQIGGDAITTETDVYSLGVILYELLAGCAPYRVTSRRFEEMERAIRVDDPRRPSTAVRRLTRPRGDGATTTRHDQTPEEIAERRATTPERLSRRLRGDLDNIVMMALRKEPARRYSSAQQFAEDIERYLDGHPVLARRDTLVYRTSKLVRRNRLAVASAALLVLALSAGIAATAWQAHVARGEARAAQLAEQRAMHEAEHAAIEAESAHEVVDFLIDSFLIAAPQRDEQDLAAARQLLERQLVRVRRQYADQPHLRANLIHAIGRVYQHLHEYDHAEALLREAAEIRERDFGRRTLEMALSLGGLGELHYVRGEYEKAVELFAECLELHDSLEPGVHTNVSLAANNLAVALRALNRLDEAEALHERALALRRAEFGPDNPLVAESLNNLAGIYIARGEPARAEALLREALAIRRDILGDAHPLVAQSASNVASVLHQSGDIVGAEAMLREAIELYRNLPATNEEELARALTKLSHIQRAQGDHDDAGASLEEARDVLVRLHGERHPHVAALLTALAQLEEARGNDAAARGHWAKALSIRSEALPADHPLLAESLTGYGLSLVKAGEADEAEPLLRQALEIYRDVHPGDDRYIGNAMINLGECLSRMERRDEGEALRREGRALLE